jgi:hypothetical protein
VLSLREENANCEGGEENEWWEEKVGKQASYISGVHPVLTRREGD